MNTTNLKKLWGIIRRYLGELSFSLIKDVVGLSGFPISELGNLQQKQKGGATKGQLLSEIDKIVNDYEYEELKIFINTICEAVYKRLPHHQDELQSNLNKIGWQFVDGNLLPIEIFDRSELHQLPLKTREDFVKALAKLSNGDLSGSIGSACSSLDSITTEIITKNNLGDPTKMSFQKKIVESFKIQSKNEIVGDLVTLGWQEIDAEMLVQNLSGSINQIAFVLQKLRSDMSDVHGTKPVLKELVYFSLKWSEVLSRILKQKDHEKN